MGITASEFEAAYRAHSRTVLRWARGIMGDRADVEDAAQNAWMAVWADRDNYDAERPFLGWMRLFVKRACWYILNPARYRRKAQLPTTALEDMPPAQQAQIEPSVDPLQEAHVEGEQLREAIDALQVRTAGGWEKTRPASQEMRDTMHMLLADNDEADIARARGVRHSAIGKLIDKAILALRHKWSVNI